MHGIFTYVYHKSQPFMYGKYTSPMDLVGGFNPSEKMSVKLGIFPK